MGVDLNQTIALTFLLGGALAGAAGVVWGLRFGYVRFDLGFNAGPEGLHGGRPRRHRQHHRRRRSAASSSASSRTSPRRSGFARWSEFLVFMILTFVLIFRPTGILGQQLGRSRMTAVDQRSPRAGAAATSPRARSRDFADDHRSSTIIIGMPIVGRPADRPAASTRRCRRHPGRADPGTTPSPTPACSCCWRWASTSSSAWPACSTSAMPRSSRSARTPTPISNSPFSGLDLPFLPMLVVGAGGRGRVRHRPRRADAAAARRLPRDHDPRLRRDRPDRLPQPRHRGPAAPTASAASTGRRRCRSSASSAR